MYPRIHFFRSLDNRLLVGWALFCMLLILPPYTQGADLTENEIKAAFLFNIPAFVGWPRDGDGRLPPLRYCTLYAEEMSELLERLIEGETLDGRTMELQRLSEGDSLLGCHILYVAGDIANLAEQPDLRNLLSVGDSETFLRAGGMVALVRRRNRIHPVVNLDAMEASPLVLSSKFLRLATRIHPNEGE